MSAPPLVLVTRPAEDAVRTGKRVVARGCRALLAPLLAIQWSPETSPLDLAGIRGLLFTSVNGVRSFVRRSGRRDLGVWTVGEATAAAARAAGFGQVLAGGGDVAALVQRVIRDAGTETGAFLHVSGQETRGDLVGQLQAAGVASRRLILYTAAPAARLPAEAETALADGVVSAVLFFSPRTARTFVNLVAAAGLAPACRTVDALCLSRACAAAAQGDAAMAVVWRGLRIADRPTEDDLMNLLPVSAPADNMMLKD